MRARHFGLFVVSRRLMNNRPSSRRSLSPDSASPAPPCKHLLSYALLSPDFRSLTFSSQLGATPAWISFGILKLVDSPLGPA